MDELRMNVVPDDPMIPVMFTATGPATVHTINREMVMMIPIVADIRR